MAIHGFNSIPVEIRDANARFFSEENATFSGDYKYSWDAERNILTIYSKVGDIFKNLLASFIGDKVNENKQAGKVIKENNRVGEKRVVLYRVDEFNKLVHVMTYFKRKKK